jgi:hypothetical protein
MSPRASYQPNYKAMAEFRYQIRRFLRFSEETARAGGLEPQQYQRRRSESDRREVLLELTPRGEKMIHDMALHHRSELREMAPDLVAALKKLVRDTQTDNGARSRRRAKQA